MALLGEGVRPDRAGAALEVLRVTAALLIVALLAVAWAWWSARNGRKGTI